MKTLVRTRRNGFNDFPSLFDEFFNDWNQGSTMKPASVSVNVRENDNAYFLEVVAPGFEKEDFNVELENDMLTISHQRKNEQNEENENYTRREYHFQSFKRSFRLPENGIDAEGINASYKSGVLHIELPKKIEEEVKSTKMIEIK